MGEARRRMESDPSFRVHPKNANAANEQEKFLYLSKRQWADAWITGGDVPISLASAYKHDRRMGTFTPDETVIHESNVDLTKMSPIIHFGQQGGIRNFSMTNCRFNGQPIPDIRNASYYTEDGCILSFSNIYSREVGRRLGKEVCVKILNITLLLSHLDEQLECSGKMGLCRYTADHRRNHFLKSVDDAWQDEFRMFWNLNKPAIVQIPSGTAEFVSAI